MRTIQLRVKDKSDAGTLRQEIVAAMDATMGTGCQLIINDHWAAALSVGCDFVHLGQEDLATADVPTLKSARVRIGVSTHDAAELAIALAVEPDYVALGPIYPSPTKSTGRAPQGRAQLEAWKARIGGCPLVAIGGITLETAPAVIRAGAASCAVVSDVLGAPDPDLRAKEWLRWSDKLMGKA